MAKRLKGQIDSVDTGEQSLIEGILDEEAILAEKARRSLSVFAEQAWPQINPSVFIPNWHTDAICEHLEALAVGQIKDLLITISPRCSKSMLCSVMFPCWAWLHWPHLSWIYASYAQSLAKNHSEKCRALITSPWYQRHYRHIYRLPKDNVTELQNDKMGYRLITSIDSGVTGRGAHIQGVDDPHNTKEAYSDVKIKNVINWWDTVMPSRVEGHIKDRRRFIVMQRVTDYDLAGHVLAQGGWEHLNIPMEFDPKRKCRTSIGWTDPRTRENELMNPKRFDQVTIDKIKGTNISGRNPELHRQMSSFDYASQYGQDPVPAEGGIIKLAWLDQHYYDDDPWYIYETCGRVIQSWDLSFKDNSDSSEVVGQVWGMKGPDLYLLHQVKGQMNFPKTLQAIKDLTRNYPRTQEKYVENKANGPAAQDSLRNQVQGIVLVDPGSESKPERGHAVSYIAEGGHVHFPNPDKYPWAADIIQAITRFPFYPTDDEFDAFTQALKKMRYVQIDPNQAPTGISTGSSFVRNWSAGNASPHYDHNSPWNRDWGNRGSRGGWGS